MEPKAQEKYDEAMIAIHHPAGQPRLERETENCLDRITITYPDEQAEK
jgi:hypothetical protein